MDAIELFGIILDVIFVALDSLNQIFAAVVLIFMTLILILAIINL